MKDIKTLKAEMISRGYEHKLVLQNLTFILNPGDRVLLKGENGAGKTTFLKVCAGQLTPESGTMTYNNKEVSQKNIKNVVSYLPSDPPPLFQRLSGEQNLELYQSLCLKYLKGEQRKAQIDHYQNLKRSWSLKLDVFKEAMNTPAYKCSMGMRQLLSIFRSLSRNCDIYLFDEPFQSLSQKSISFVIDSIEQDFKQNTFLITTHQILEEKIFNRKLNLINGKLHE